MKYDPKRIESKWQERWQNDELFVVPEKSKGDTVYILDMFPYPSGDGLHVGHVKIYTGADVAVRYYRMRGKTVLHPTGWDAFGLPTENSAIKFGVHPSELTKRNTDRFRKQMQMMGWSYDWSREINTTDPVYYKWTQWIFLQLFKKGLAYEDTIPINWCPSCKTGLANEEVIDGHCDRCGHVVELKDMRQWLLKITAYADRLLKGLDSLQWPKFILDMQRNWIGRSEGALLEFRISGGTSDTIQVFTTRPDTVFGATYIVLAPEHRLISNLFSQENVKNPKEVQAYIEQAKHKTELQRKEDEKEKTGVQLEGITAVNPATQKEVPVWIADYVLTSYGTGAIMAVPAHDERDFAFASKFDIPVTSVIEREDTNDLPYTGDGTLIHSGDFSGRPSAEVRQGMAEAFGIPHTQYKLRDWVFSRQRYWGEPIPIIHCEMCGVVPVPEEDLPVILPDVERYEPTGTGESPLAAIDEWVNVNCPKCGGGAKRETNTMPQWAGSSWYWLRYLDPQNAEVFAGKAQLKKWLPVDLYVGGAEHAVLHLLYARFWNMVLFDEGYIPSEEPFIALRNVGLVLGADGQKMSKSRGNVINPDDEVSKHGADAVRIFAMFMGPFEDTAAWTTEGLIGAERFVNRVWNFIHANKTNTQSEEDEQVYLALQRTIKRVTDGVEQFRFNTSIASLMELLNILERQGAVTQATLDAYVCMISPFAPHVADELWEVLGHTESVQMQSWPVVDEDVLAHALVVIPVQVNGKVRGELTLEPDASQEVVEKMAREIENVQKHLSEVTIIKVIYIPGRMLNFVAQ